VERPGRRARRPARPGGRAGRRGAGCGGAVVDAAGRDTDAAGRDTDAAGRDTDAAGRDAVAGRTDADCSAVGDRAAVASREMSGILRVAAVQTVSGGDVAANLAQARELVAAAASAGASLVLLPEYFGILGARATDKVRERERDGEGPQQAFLSAAAREHRIVLVGGSVPLACDDPARVRSACLAYGPDGARIARYDKIHLFRFAQGDEAYDETRTIERGSAPATFDVQGVRIGMSICYDVRFPELYRALRDCALFLVPSAFTWTTGSAHWHLLLRARAVENQAYVLAAAQGGTHANGRRTFGHSMLVDPWGEIVAERSDDGPGVIVGDVDPARIAEVRGKLPAHAHRVL